MKYFFITLVSKLDALFFNQGDSVALSTPGKWQMMLKCTEEIIIQFDSTSKSIVWHKHLFIYPL